MKRLLPLLLMLALTVTAALADGSGSDIRHQAYDIMLERYGYAPEALQAGEMDSFSDGWIVRFTVPDHPDDTDGLYILFFTRDGVLESVSEPTEQTLPMQVGNDMNAIRNARGNAYDTQSYERLAAFTEKWLPRQDEIAAHLTDPTVELSMLALNARLPDEGAMTYDQARQTALALMTRQPGFTEAFTRMYMIFADGYIQPEGFDHPVWSFFFHLDFERSTRAFEQAFNHDPPLYIILLFDAVDGTLAAEPMVEYRSPRFSPMDYFTRTPAVLAWFEEE